MEKVENNPDPIQINAIDNPIMVGVWNNKLSKNENYLFTDPEIFYFECTIFYQTYNIENGLKIS
jgi:hypothetical protein